MNKLVLCLLTLLLVGCATVDSSKQVAKQPAEPKKLPEETMARIVPQPISKLDYDLLIAMTNTHASPEDMIAELEKESIDYDLTPSQVLTLNQAGIDASVLDYLHQRSRGALQDEVEAVYADYQKQCSQRISLVKRALLNRPMVNDPFCRGGVPWVYPRRFNGRILFW